jgi:hypothetical protein
VNAADTVIDAVRRVEFGPLTTFRNLGLLALSTAGERRADYLTLDEAIERHKVHIVEVSEGGDVPELKIVNEGELPAASAVARRRRSSSAPSKTGSSI